MKTIPETFDRDGSLSVKMPVHAQSPARRPILFGTPILTLLLLIMHPLPDPVHMPDSGVPAGMDVYNVMAPLADRFLAVHGVFALALGLLGLSVILLLKDVRGMAATISRIGAFIFAVTYIMYETIIGTVTALLVRNGATLPPDEQAVIGAAIYRNFQDPLFGDLPSLLSVVAWLAWLLTVTLAAFALRRSGKPRLPCILLGLSFIFVSHASSLGPLGILLFLIAVVGLERAGVSAAQRRATIVADAPPAM